MGNAKATPSKLMALRSWFEIPAAATYLRDALKHEVTEAEVLRSALDGKLKLSVRFVNPTQASPDRPFTETEVNMLAQREAEIAAGDTSLKDSCWPPGIEQITLTDDPYDLPMIGAEARYVEARCQQLTQGPAVALNYRDGTFVDTEEGARFRLWQPNRIEIETISTDEAEWVTAVNVYSPAHGLPEDSVLVVRKAVLDEFVRRHSGTSIDRPLKDVERDKLLAIIWILFRESDLDPTELRGAGDEIERRAAKWEVKVSSKTISKYLTEAKHLFPEV